MKKAKSDKSAPVRKSKVATNEVDEYLERVPEPARTALNKVRAVIRSVAPPEATEGISYGIPTFKYKGTLASFAAFSDHCSLFPGAGPTIEFKNELKNFQTSKGTIRFAPYKPFPANLLKKLIKERIKENERKKGR
ncbi:MAG: DUF1801 domain-containing protein [Candidatus Sulfotelmatobacter sp.]|jgi:uncharacterized protein YdhG (YjbR/CyaY superfamily)